MHLGDQTFERLKNESGCCGDPSGLANMKPESSGPDASLHGLELAFRHGSSMVRDRSTEIDGVESMIPLSSDCFDTGKCRQLN